MTTGDLAAYRALTARQRRAVRRAVRRGRRARFDSGLAGPLLVLARLRQARARRLLVLAVLVILASTGATLWVALREGAGPLLAVPVAGLLVGGIAGVLSESRLRRAEEAESLAAQRVGPPAPAPPAARTPTSPSVAATPEGEPAPIPPVPGDAARERLARILSGTHAVRPQGERTREHPWD